MHTTAWTNLTKHYTEQNKPDKKEYMLYDSIYMKLLKNKKKCT